MKQFIYLFAYQVPDWTDWLEEVPSTWFEEQPSVFEDGYTLASGQTGSSLSLAEHPDQFQSYVGAFQTRDLLPSFVQAF